MERVMQSWMLPWVVVVVYPGLILSFDRAINGYHESGSLLLAAAAVLTMAAAASIPALATRALLIMRDDPGKVLTRGVLYVMFASSSLFSLALSLARMADIQRPGFIALWVATWFAVGVMLYLRGERSAPTQPEGQVTRLRIVHGVTALTLLCGFLLAHLINHDLAVWSVELHGSVMTWLRQWYRSEWVEPVLLALMLIMIGTGIPMVRHYARQRMNAFRIVQTATGVYVGVFICSHVTAILRARYGGVETDWFFASGTSLLNGAPMSSRLIPHYAFGTFFLILHIACGLRVVLVQHGLGKVFANRALYGATSAGVVVVALAMAALLGFHIETSD